MWDHILSIIAKDEGKLAVFLIIILLTGFFFLISLQKKKKNSTVKILKNESVGNESKNESHFNEKTWEDRVAQGLSKSRLNFWPKLKEVFLSGGEFSEQLNNVEELLYQSDLSPIIVGNILSEVKKSGKIELLEEKVKEILRSKINLKNQEMIPSKGNFQDLWTSGNIDFKSSEKKLPLVVLILGVNGAGKTTTIGKMAFRMQKMGLKVVVGAADTFRPAATEQLQKWCERSGAELVQGKSQGDPAAVAYAATAKAIELQADICLIDTAGRLHNNSQLMEELKKIKKVIGKLGAEFPHETMLVIDSMMGQNALKQATLFHENLQLSGLILTKCDGSAKAGTAFSIVENLKVPILFVGVGEEPEDLDIFNPHTFVNSLFLDSDSLKVN